MGCVRMEVMLNQTVAVEAEVLVIARKILYHSAAAGLLVLS